LLQGGKDEIQIFFGFVFFVMKLFRWSFLKKMKFFFFDDAWLKLPVEPKGFFQLPSSTVF